MATRKPLVPVYKSAEKTATNGTIIDSLSSGSTKDAPSINAVKKGKTATKIDSIVQEELDLSSTRLTTCPQLKVQVQDAKGNSILPETSVDQVFLVKSNRSEVNLKDFLTTLTMVIQNVSFYDTLEAVKAKNELLEFMEVN